MKIGILSLVLHTNYGGILQSYALQTILERMGHEVVVLTRDRDVHVNLIRVFLSWCRCFVLRSLGIEHCVFFNPWKQNAERLEREQYTYAFVKNNIHMRVIRNITSNVFADRNAIVVGSDQVWRSEYFKRQWGTTISNAYLKFLGDSDLKRIAYSASFGTDKWEYTEEETKECASLLNKFNAVSVREFSGIDLCKDKLSYNNAKVVLDPTLLLDKNDYIHLVNLVKTEQSPGNLMCYLLDRTEEKMILIDRIAKDRNLIPFHANSRIEDKNAPQKERIQPPVEQWIRGFMDAEFVVTDSFHACVFSIIFRKPFVVVGNAKRGQARFTSLLSMFDLDSHIISKIDDYHPEMSYLLSEKSSVLLNKRKAESMGFLVDALK